MCLCMYLVVLMVVFKKQITVWYNIVVNLYYIFI